MMRVTLNYASPHYLSPTEYNVKCLNNKMEKLR